MPLRHRRSGVPAFAFIALQPACGGPLHGGVAFFKIILLQGIDFKNSK